MGVNFTGTGGSWLSSGLFEVQYCFTNLDAVNPSPVRKMPFLTHFIQIGLLYGNITTKHYPKHIL